METYSKVKLNKVRIAVLSNMLKEQQLNSSTCPTIVETAESTRVCNTD